MVAIPATSSTGVVRRWVPGHDSASANALIKYTGPWSVAELSRAQESSKRSESTAAASSTRWIDSNGSLSVSFDGHEGSLIGGMSFKPPPDFAFCTIDGATVDSDAHQANEETAKPLCHVTGLEDGPHVLTFNITNIPSGKSDRTPADVPPNRLWIDGFSYAATSRWNLAARQDSSSTSPSSASSTTSPTSSPAPSTSAAPQDPTDSNTSSKTAVRIGEIAGGIIGGALLVVFLRGLFFYVQRNDGTRKAVGRPESPTYESGWTLPKFGKGYKGGDPVKPAPGKDVSAQGDVPLSPLKKEDHGKAAPPETPAEYPAQAPVLLPSA